VSRSRQRLAGSPTAPRLRSAQRYCDTRCVLDETDGRRWWAHAGDVARSAASRSVPGATSRCAACGGVSRSGSGIAMSRWRGDRMRHARAISRADDAEDSLRWTPGQARRCAIATITERSSTCARNSHRQLPRLSMRTATPASSLQALTGDASLGRLVIRRAWILDDIKRANTSLPELPICATERRRGASWCPEKLTMNWQLHHHGPFLRCELRSVAGTKLQQDADQHPGVHQEVIRVAAVYRPPAAAPRRSVPGVAHGKR
jgi:hypothetical protein